MHEDAGSLNGAKQVVVFLARGEMDCDKNSTSSVSDDNGVENLRFLIKKDFCAVHWDTSGGEKEGSAIDKLSAFSSTGESDNYTG